MLEELQTRYSDMHCGPCAGPPAAAANRSADTRSDNKFNTCSAKKLSNRQTVETFSIFPLTSVMAKDNGRRSAFDP